MSHARFSTLLFVLGLLASLAVSAQAQTRLRLVAANISSANYQSYPVPGPGQRMLQGLNPDVIMIQEFNIGNSTGVIDSSTAAVQSFANSVIGATASWYRESGAQIPNGIISRYPILASGEWDDTQVSNRDFAWARIDIPGSKDLWAISVHLLTSSAGVRNTEATALSAFINANVPAGDYVAIGGDFNTDSRGESALSSLSSVVVTSSPYPADQNGNGNTNASRGKPYDWLLADSDLHALKTPLIIGGSTYTNGLVLDTRVYTPLSEISPAQSSDSSASNMQHMAVVRDFMIPASGDYSVSPTSVAFGTVNASSGPVTNSSVTISRTNTFTLNSVNFTGAYASEFTLVSPTLPASITANTPLTFRWTPAANDGAARSVTATFATAGTPASFAVTLTGTTMIPGGQNFTVSPTSINFGTVSATSAPFNNSSVQLTVTNPFEITAVEFTGTGAGEFSMTNPNVEPGAVQVTGNRSLTFRWQPYINDGSTRNVTARVYTSTSPSSFTLTLQGTLQAAGSGGGTPLDIGGYKLRQLNSTQNYTIPAGTIIQPGGTVVVARGDASQTRSSFETYWGVTMPAEAVYVNSGGNTVPQMNGSETYELMDASSVNIDGPSAAVSSSAGENRQRNDVDAAAGTAGSWTVGTSAVDGVRTPGSFSGTRHFGGKLIISEISDAPAYINEFIELFYDAASGSTPPVAPTGVATIAGDGEVVVNWNTHPDGALTGFYIYRSTTSGSGYVRLNDVPISGTQYVDSAVLNGTTYYYVVRAVKTPDQSATSAQASALPTASTAAALSWFDLE